ncbi:microtubule-associated protein futsch-like isoform X2 [Solanum pennellii]|uniref:Microtubule-associated protein futsch-like isoform X2 n=1 Tax=Solanum pennellii TaxID=28526 RepID=A0ABM1FE33_SOLPN|nr:microtubule-associated protein futsch-like isoform X2 [Solanum pennellii]
MGVGLVEIGVEMRKILMFSIKGCYVTVLNHPFLVSMLCFIAFLYRSFPFLFSILLAVSPVLVCTAVLLGTLLSFGQPNIPEIEREEKTSSHDIVPLRTGVLYDTTHIESADDSYYVERYTERGLVDQSIDKISDLSPLPEERSRDFQFGNGGFEEAGREFHEQNYKEKHGDGELTESQYSPIPTVDEDFEEAVREFYEQKNEEHDDGELLESQYSSIPTVDEDFEEAAREFYEQNSEKSEEKHDDGELMESQYSPIPTVDNESIEFDFDRSDSFDSRRVNLNSLPGSPWKKERKEEEEQEEEEEDDDDESFDSESDRAESSSPDASMADIIPMLHELHPLLDEDTTQHVSLLHDGSDAASDSSGKTTESDNESDDGVENQEELEVADDENEDGEDDEGKQDEEDISKSAITWTEEDQKNLIDLGSSEIERNQRLENLMARRRALKKMRLMMTEKNLIDLESADLPFNIPSISTARNNPFDVHNDNYDLGLPPIPGSAPSVLVPRRNPFDLPYDSSEEKPNLMEDEQDFITFQAKDPLFRRHESFIVRPSIFGLNRQDKQDSHLRPYFVPERMATEGTSYSPFQRQSSELSDSKVSSVPETESLSSVEDLEDSNLIEGQLRHKSLDQEELECRNLMDEHISEEPEHTSEHVKHGSQSSEEVESLVQLGTVKNHHDAEETLLQEGRITNALELNPTEIQSKPETSYQRYSSQSSSSSLAEVSERVFIDKEGEMRSSFEEIMGHIEENGISRQASFDGPDFHITSTSVDHTPREHPIYDSSPSAIRENIFSASFSSDQHVESETVFPPTLVEESTISFVERESEENSQDIEKNSLPTNEEILAPADDQEFLSREVVCQNELDVAKADISEDDEVFGSANALQVPELVVSQTSIDSESSADEDMGHKEGTIDHAQHQVSSSRFDADTHVVSHLVVNHAVESLSTSSDHQNIRQMGDEQHSLIAEVPLDQPVMPSLEKQSVEDVTEKEEPIVSEQHDLPSSDAVESSVTDALSEVDETQTSVGHQYASTERSISQCEEGLAYSDKSIDEHPSDDKEVKETPAILVESIEEASTTETLNVSEIHDLDDGIPIISSPRTPNSISNLHEVVEAPRGASLSGLKNMILEENDNQIKVLENYVLPPEAADFQHDELYIVEETDGIEDIDEAFLYELDTVGDFSINELGSCQNEFERRIDSTGEGLSAFHTVDSGTPEVAEDAFAEVHERKFPLHPDILNASTFQEIDFAEGEVHNAVDARSIEGGVPVDSDIGPSDPMTKLNLDAQEIVPEMTIAEAQNSVFEVANAESAQTGVTKVPQEVIVRDETDSGMPVLEAQTIQDIESAFWQVYEKEMEKSNVFELYNAEDSGMPVLEAQTVEDIELAFRGTSENETLNSNVYELPNAKLVTEKSGSSDNSAVFKISSQVLNDSGMPEVEAHTIEEIESAFGISSEKEKEHLNVVELPNAKLVTEESRHSDDAAVFEVSSSVKEDSEMPVVEAQTIEDIESAFRISSEKEIVHSNVVELHNAKLPDAKLVTEESGDSDDAAVFNVSNSIQEDSEMPVVEAQTIEDIESAFRISSEKEIVHSNVLELPNAKLVTEESVDSDDEVVFDVSSSVQEDSGMPVVEAQTIEDIESALRISSEEEIVHSNVLELPNGKLVTEESVNSDDEVVFDVSSSVQEDSGIPVLEAQTAEDINLTFRQIGEKSNVLEQRLAELATEESGDFDNGAVFDMSSSVQADSGMPVLEAQTAEDITLAFRQISEQEIEKSNVLEQPHAKLETEESGDFDNAAMFDVSSTVHEDSGMPVLEAQTVEDINFAFRQISEQEIAEKSNVLEQSNAELTTEEPGNSVNAAVFEVSGSVLEDPQMPIVEAQTAEDINLAFRQISEQEIDEKSNVLEQPNAELATEESGNVAAAAEVSSSALEDSEMPVPEAEIFEDIDMIFRRISEKEMKKSNVLEQPHAELATEVSGSSDNTAVLEASSVTRNMQLPILETRPTEYFDLDHEKLSESDDETLIRHDSVGGDEHPGESEDVGASSDSQTVETDLSLKQVLEGNLEKPLNYTSEGESAQAKPSEAGSSNDMESSVRGSDLPDSGEAETEKGDHEVVLKEAKTPIAEKPDHAVDMPATSDVKGKKDKSHETGSSSSSSSSSDSSSSDSDKE